MSNLKKDPQYIALCAKVTQELESQYGLKDEDLTEFIISLGKESKTDKEFMKNLQENDAEFTFSFTKNIFTLIKNMLPQAPAQKDTSVLKDHVSSKEEKKANERTTTSNQGNRTLAEKFPGLSMPNKPNPEELDLGLDLAPTTKEDDKSQRRKPDISKPDVSKSRSRSRSRSGDRHKKKHSKKRRSPSSRSRSRSRSSSSRRDRKRKDKREEYEGDPTIGRVYEGTVTSVMDYGCFVSLNNFRKKTEGLVHVSNIKSERIGHPKEHVSKGQRVKVKVVSNSKGKIGLSMKEVDQDTGENLGDRDRDRSRRSGNDRGDRSKGESRSYGSITGIKLDEQKGSQKNKKTMDIDPFELSILKSKGKVGTLPKDLLELEEVNAEEDVQEIEVEVKEEEPGFLKGQTTRAGIDLSPVRVVKNPKGSLQHEIMSSMQIARERGENKSKQEQAGNQEKEGLPKFSKVFKSDSASKPNPFAENSEERRQNYEQSFLPETRRKKLAILDQRKSLPIYKFREELMKAIKENKILIVIGETGSGKTTQILQYLYEEGYTRGGKRIGCTQPRKVSATSIAKRVAEEMGVKLGEEVGYAIRFEDHTSPKTVLKYMTEGVLLREALSDKNVSNYRVVVLDEAHERTINMDVLFGLMKQTAERRDDFRLIVTSATLDAEKFSQYFYNCNIFRIPGRTFPVDVMYTKEPESDYLEAALTTVMQIHLTEPPGDILMFLTGQEEIDTSCMMLNERMKKLGDDAPELICLPIYSALPSELQDRIFEPAPIGARKCVIATNIAEASLTIDGIYYVIDPGFAKIKTYDAKQRMDTLKVSPISQASANQRAGRAGRTGPGKCFRLYTEQAFKGEMLPVSVPEIQRTNLANTVLILKAMGINDLINFDFMDPPPIQTLVAALETLYALSALDDDGYLTKLGRKMSEFPLDPELSKMLLTAVDLGCTDEVTTIIAMLSVQNIFYRPKERQQQADEKRAQFFHPDGDHITMLTVFQNWESNQYSPGWCHENFVQLRTMRKAQDTKKQLRTILERSKLPVVKCNNDFQRIRKAITAGFFSHAARKDPQEGYKTLIEGQQVYIHPSSSLFSKSPDWVMYHELVLTSKEFMREVCTIEPKWLIEVAPNFFKMADPNTISKRKKAEKLEPLQNKHEDPNAWRLSRRKG